MVKEKESEINWHLKEGEAATIDCIVERFFNEVNNPNDAHSLAEDLRQHIHMDIAACHLNGTPLWLEKLLDAPTNVFLHDVHGISHHMNRDTGKIENCFLPKCAIKGPKFKLGQTVWFVKRKYTACKECGSCGRVPIKLKAAKGKIERIESVVGVRVCCPVEYWVTPNSCKGHYKKQYETVPEKQVFGTLKEARSFVLNDESSLV